MDLAGDLVGSGGSLQWIATSELAAPAQNIDVVMPALAEMALVEYFLLNGAGGAAVTYDWWPNAADPGTAAISSIMTPGGGATVDGSLRLTTTNQQVIQGELRVFLATGKPRRFAWRHQSFDRVADPAALSQVVSEGVWTNEATELASLRCRSDNAAGFGAGSFLRVWGLYE